MTTEIGLSHHEKTMKELRESCSKAIVERDDWQKRFLEKADELGALKAERMRITALVGDIHRSLKHLMELKRPFYTKSWLRKTICPTHETAQWVLYLLTSVASDDSNNNTD